MRQLKILMLILIFVMTGCMGDSVNKYEVETQIPTEEETMLPSLTDKIISTMTLEEMVYQMMYVTPEALTGEASHTIAGENLQAALKECPVGGIVYFAENFETRQQTIEMIENTKTFSKVGLFIGVDEEGGKVSRLGKKKDMGVELLPPMGSVKTKEEAFIHGNKVAEDIKALGFNMNFAPVADVLINPKNTEIGSRSFGSVAQDVTEKVSAFVRGMKKAGIASVLKHFPGHGSTTANSHTGYSESGRLYEELKNEEFLPFKGGIETGAEFVMLSHMTLVNATEEKVPSSVSKEVATRFLRQELGFEGIIITDSFSMGAITKEYSCEEAAVKAVEAGVDMILMPEDLKVAVDAIVNAVNEGRIQKERIEESVRQILSTKEKLGLLHG